MANNKLEVKLIFNPIIKMSFWDAVKIRIAGVGVQTIENKVAEVLKEKEIKSGKG